MSKTKIYNKLTKSWGIKSSNLTILQFNAVSGFISVKV